VEMYPVLMYLITINVLKMPQRSHPGANIILIHRKGDTFMRNLDQ